MLKNLKNILRKKLKNIYLVFICLALMLFFDINDDWYRALYYNIIFYTVFIYSIFIRSSGTDKLILFASLVGLTCYNISDYVFQNHLASLASAVLFFAFSGYQFFKRELKSDKINDKDCFIISFSPKNTEFLFYASLLPEPYVSKMIYNKGKLFGSGKKFKYFNKKLTKFYLDKAIIKKNKIKPRFSRKKN